MTRKSRSVRPLGSCQTSPYAVNGVPMSLKAPLLLGDMLFDNGNSKGNAEKIAFDSEPGKAAHPPDANGVIAQSYRFVVYGDAGKTNWVPWDLLKFLDMTEADNLHWVAANFPSGGKAQATKGKTTYVFEKQGELMRISYLENGVWVGKPAVIRR